MGPRSGNASRASHIPPADTTDLVVLADFLVTDPWVVRELHSCGIAHLPVRLRDGTGLVGPLAVPGCDQLSTQSPTGTSLAMSSTHTVPDDPADPEALAALRAPAGWLRPGRMTWTLAPQGQRDGRFILRLHWTQTSDRN
jgi:hypothetical protein